MIPTALFLAALLIPGALWVFHQTAEDVYMVLAVAIALICFIIVFAHSHWLAQSLIGLVLLVSINRLIRAGIPGQQ
jgi:hypothetical protein